MVKKGIFGKERFCYVLLDFWYTKTRIEDIVGVLGGVVPRDVYYELCLVTADSA